MLSENTACIHTAYLHPCRENPCAVVAIATEATFLKICTARGQSEAVLGKSPIWPHSLSATLGGHQERLMGAMVPMGTMLGTSALDQPLCLFIENIHILLPTRGLRKASKCSTAVFRISVPPVPWNSAGIHVCEMVVGCLVDDRPCYTPFLYVSRKGIECIRKQQIPGLLYNSGLDSV